MEAVRQTLEVQTFEDQTAFCLATAMSECEFLNDLFLGDLTNASNVTDMENTLLRLADNVGKLRAGLASTS